MSLPVERSNTPTQTAMLDLQQHLRAQQEAASRNAERAASRNRPVATTQAAPGNVSRPQGEAARFGLEGGAGALKVNTPLRDPVIPPGPGPGAQKEPDVQQAADRVMNAGVRWLIKDDYEARMDVFGEELLKGDKSYQGKLVAEIVERDPGAFKSWLQGGRMDSLVDGDRISPTERRAMLDGLGTALQSGQIERSQVPSGFVRDSHDPALTGAYMGRLNLDDRDDFGRALDAFSGLGPDDLRSFIADPQHRTQMLDLTLAVQQHQDWYESRSIDMVSTGAGTMHAGAWPVEMEAPLQFSKEQLSAMREAFMDDNGLMTNGELLLAYPDRLERNEQVTHQYHELSAQMGGIVGADNANWATFAQWASDEVGRNLKGTPGIAVGEFALGNPRYWLSVGNSRLVSDIGPGFRHFVDTFKDGKNHDMSFDKFWKGFEEKWGGRGISYLDGHNDPKLDMKNAFKAYYDAMQLKDKEDAATDPSQREALAGQRGQLMLYGNLLVGLQEQQLIQPELENGLKAAPMINGGMVNPGGAGRLGIDFHLPGTADPSHARKLDTNEDVPATPFRVEPRASFTTVGGETIDLDDAIRKRLNDLDMNNGEDEFNRANSNAPHWEKYGDRMSYIYHLFAGYQRDPQLAMDPRDAFASRATPLNNDPSQVVG
jgi:hypothetical protein